MGPESEFNEVQFVAKILFIYDNLFYPGEEECYLEEVWAEPAKNLQCLITPRKEPKNQNIKNIYILFLPRQFLFYKIYFTQIIPILQNIFYPDNSFFKKYILTT